MAWVGEITDSDFGHSMRTSRATRRTVTAWTPSGVAAWNAAWVGPAQRTLKRARPSWSVRALRRVKFRGRPGLRLDEGTQHEVRQRPAAPVGDADLQRDDLAWQGDEGRRPAQMDAQARIDLDRQRLQPRGFGEAPGGGEVHLHLVGAAGQLMITRPQQLGLDARLFALGVVVGVLERLAARGRSSEAPWPSVAARSRSRDAITRADSAMRGLFAAGGTARGRWRPTPARRKCSCRCSADSARRAASRR